MLALASLSAGYLQFNYGWETVNVGVLPLLFIVLVSILFLARTNKKLINEKTK